MLVKSDATINEQQIAGCTWIRDDAIGLLNGASLAFILENSRIPTENNFISFWLAKILQLQIWFDIDW